MTCLVQRWSTLANVLALLIWTATPLSWCVVQGREKDVAIFSTVRTSLGRSIGFVADERRVNVGLTRARSSLIVIGNAKALHSDERWGNLIRQAKIDKWV